MHHRDVVLLGGGGHAKVVIDVLLQCGWHVAGILDPSPAAEPINGIAVLGDDERAEGLLAAGYRAAFVALGDNRLRRQLGLRMKAIGYDLVTAIHPSAVVSPSASLGDGVIVMPNAVINASARVGSFSIINTAAVIEHDCVLGEAVHAAPRSVIGGGTTIGDETLFGIGASARPQSSIGARAIVGAGAVVIEDVGAETVVFGVPARERSSRSGRHHRS